MHSGARKGSILESVVCYKEHYLTISSFSRMRGIAVLAVLLLAVAANARGPPTRTKKGKRPSDNPDIGLPSGKDIPDGRRFVPPAGPRAAPVPPARVPAGAPAPAPVGYNKPLPPAAARPPVPALPAGRPAGGIPPTRTRAGKRPAGRMGPAYGFAPPAPVVPKNPPVFANPWLAAPVAPVAPVVSCDAKCGYFWSPVCSVYGNTYDNDCRLACSGEPYACEGQCPCEEPKSAQAAPAPLFGYFGTSSCGCGFNYDPVCTDDGDEVINECTANCEGKTIACSSHCPC